MTEIIEKPFDWNDNLSEIAQEDFSRIQKNLSYGTATSVGMALAKLELLEKQGCKVESQKSEDNGWIHLSDKKPKFGEDVLILIKHSDGTYQQAFSALYDYTYWTNFGRDICVTHWRPLLELPDECKTMTHDDKEVEE